MEFTVNGNFNHKYSQFVFICFLKKYIATINRLKGLFYRQDKRAVLEMYFLVCVVMMIRQ